MTINERFQTIIDIMFGGNKRAFAIHVGVSPTVVENVVGTRKGKPSFDFLYKVCANANISAEWLLMGKGEMLWDMLEPRKVPMVFHSNPELYIQEGKTEITDEDTASESPSNADLDTNQSNEGNRILMNLLKEKDKEIGNNREEIGRLKARIEQLERELNEAREFPPTVQLDSSVAQSVSQPELQST